MFTFHPMNMQGLFLITPKVYSDERGFFMETYKKSEFLNAGITQEFLQDNHSRSHRGVLRGLHYQSGDYAQGKLVRFVKGQIFDVAVDIRKESPTFGHWYGIILSEDNFYMLYIPEGFAHGFYTISEEAETVYKTTSEYKTEADKGIIWNDPDINIFWPSFNPKLSPKDMKHPKLKDIK